MSSSSSVAVTGSPKLVLAAVFSATVLVCAVWMLRVMESWPGKTGGRFGPRRTARDKCASEFLSGPCQSV